MTAILDRGFKSWAERTAASLRNELSLSAHEPLDPRKLAAFLDVDVCTPNEITGLTSEAKHQLLVVDPSGWSAVTIQNGEKSRIIYNPIHSTGRQASDITHELAHVVLGHKPAILIMSNDGQLVMRSYDQKQEDEANWLAWALLLPRDGLLYCKRQRFTTLQIAQHFGVSEKLVSYRIGITGIEVQMKRAGRF